jgi:ComF family protein
MTKRTFFSVLFDFFLPHFCINCKKDGDLLCEECLNEIKFFTQKNRNVLMFNKGPNLYLDQLIYFADYNNTIIKKVIWSFKYDGYKQIGVIITKYFCEYLRNSNFFNDSNLSSYCLTFVPLHKSKLYERGFNQSEIIAKIIAQDFSIICCRDLILRIKKTSSQMTLNLIKRKANVKNAFILNKKVINKLFYKNKKNRQKLKYIILVDDVYTTGQTMNECAKILKKHGFEKVIGLALAKEN